jgi:hypothetical protein
MSHPMYLLQNRTAFRLPSNLGPQAIYYGLRTPIVDGLDNPVLNVEGNPTYVPLPALDCAMQATIDGACNYWLSYQNIKQACYNRLNDGINNAFKFSPNSNLT